MEELTELEQLQISVLLNTKNISAVAFGILNIPRLASIIRKILQSNTDESVETVLADIYSHDSQQATHRIPSNFYNLERRFSASSDVQNEALDLSLKSAKLLESDLESKAYLSTFEKKMFNYFFDQNLNLSHESRVTELSRLSNVTVDENIASEKFPEVYSPAVVRCKAQTSTDTEMEITEGESQTDGKKQIRKYEARKLQDSITKKERNVFPSKRPKKCHLCEKVVRADNFVVHLRAHTGEKPFKCPICPFRSANPSSMPKHLRLHKKGKQILYCKDCNYSTLYKSNYSAHIKTHKSVVTTSTKS